MNVAAPLEHRVPALAPLVAAGVLGPAEVHATVRIGRLWGLTDPLVQLAVALAYWAPLHGHACVDLEHLGDALARQAGAAHEGPAERALPAMPPLDRWLGALRASTAVRWLDHADDGADGRAQVADAPLVLNGHRLALQRQWVDECTVAAALVERCDRTEAPLPLPAASTDLLERLLVGSDDPQRRAATALMTSRLAVIVGGPGTGKTHTIARALATAMADADRDGRSLRVALCAPTGKAAQRMREAVTAALGEIPAGTLPPAVVAQLGTVQPTTVHRLLGARPGWRTRFAHDAATPLPHDLVIVDEASMLALPLMARLLDALRPSARLVLVGDPDQLESVEVGAVLGDVVRAAGIDGSALAGNVVRLQRPRRYDGASTLGRVADAIAAGDAAEVISLLRTASVDPASTVRLVEQPDPLAGDAAAAVQAVVTPVVRATVSAAVAGDAAGALAHQSSVRVLCAHRAGRYGAATLNRAVEGWAGVDGGWYPGRSVLVTRNDPRTGLVNGDVGVVVVRGGRRTVAFASPDGGDVRLVEPAQLDHVETAVATTIHKSQGSEHPSVVVVLPPPTSPLLTRELLYTAVTRSRGELVIVGTEAAIHAAVTSPSSRMTGLVSALTRPRSIPPR